MKTRLKISFFFLLLMSILSPLDTEAQSFDGVVNAFRTGNSSALASNFETNVEVTIKNSGNSYSKNQAEMVVRNFFVNNTPKSFSVVHQGTSPEGSKYFIGNLVTSSGNFRTYVYAKPVGGRLMIQEIRIEE